MMHEKEAAVSPPRETKLTGPVGKNHPWRAEPLPEAHHGRVPFTLAAVKRDAIAGTVTGLMALPLTVGICLMSDYPIQVGLMTVICACLISFIVYHFRPGNHVGVPGVAAGLAPVLALGVHRFGAANMPWVIFLTSTLQMLVWRYQLEKYILKAVPKFLVEGLLAGVGLKIAMKFLPDTYRVVSESSVFWSADRLAVVLSSACALIAFVALYRKFKETSPGIPYIAVIGGSIWLGTRVSLPMLRIDSVPIQFAWPWKGFSNISPHTHLEMFFSRRCSCSSTSSNR